MSALLLQRRLTAYGVYYFSGEGENVNVRKEGRAHSSPS